MRGSLILRQKTPRILRRTDSVEVLMDKENRLLPRMREFAQNWSAD